MHDALPGLVAAFAVAMAAPARADRAVTGSVVDDATGLPVAGALATVGGGEAATDDQAYPGAPGDELRTLGSPIDLTTFPSAIYFGER